VPDHRLLFRAAPFAYFAYFAVCQASLFAFFAFFAVNSFAQTPPNDQFNNRFILSGTNISVTGSNIGATKQNREPDHAGNVGGASVWWSWTAPTNGDLTITTDGSTNTDGSELDTLLGIYTGSSVSALSLVVSNDDQVPGLFVTSRVRFQAIKGTNYQIAVDGFNDGTGADTGSITLNLVFISEPILRPPNDSFTNRISLSGASTTTNGSNVEATREPGEPLHADQMGDTSVWWSWTAPANDPVTITTAGSDFDTLLAVYTGPSVSNLTVVASNDDTDPTNGVLTSSVSFTPATGQNYGIAVDGFDGASGLISLRIATVTTRLSAPLLLPHGTFQFDLNGSPGGIYEIDATTNFITWIAVGAITNTTGTGTFSDLTATNFGQRFYRALLKP